MAFGIFSLALCTRLNLPHSIARNFSQCICGQAIDLTWIHLLCCVHGGERTTTHDIIWNSFVSIARDVRFHVLCEQAHVFLMPSF
jgi:hypothetical protein